MKHIHHEIINYEDGILIGRCKCGLEKNYTQLQEKESLRIGHQEKFRTRRGVTYKNFGIINGGFYLQGGLHKTGKGFAVPFEL